MNKDTIKHEILHILGATYGLYKYALKYQTSFKKLFDKTSVHLCLRGNFEAGTSGEVTLDIPDMPQELWLKIIATSALIPATAGDEPAIREVIRTGDVSAFYRNSELSEQDRAAYDRSPVPSADVINASIVAQEYMNLFGVHFHKFAKALDPATLSHDELPLNAVVNFDRFTTAVRHLPEQRNQLYTMARHVD